MDQNKKQTLSFCIVLHQPNLVVTDSDTTLVQDAWNKTLFPAITYSYIPLLKMLDHFSSNKIPVKINMVITPTLCSLLDDYMVQELYTLWVENLIVLGETEIEKHKNNPEIKALVEDYLKKLNQAYSYFAGLSEGNLLLRFKEHVNNGTIELLTTCAEHSYLPHYNTVPELINAQIEAGIMSHKKFFNTVSDGFWLPLMGYTPGIEDTIQSYGFDYTILNTHGILFGDPSPENGIFSPLRCQNSLSVFGHDNVSWESLFGEEGLSKNSIYRDQTRDIGYENDMKELEMVFYSNNARFETGYKYFSNESSMCVYNLEKALQQTKEDAVTFCNNITKRIQEASNDSTVENTNILCVIDAKMLGQTWYEGVNWLSEVLRLSQEDEYTSIVSLSELSKFRANFPKTNFFMSSSEGNGYGENLLDNSNSWIYRYNLKIAERMIDLTQKFPNDVGLRERALNMAAKIILYATSSDWAKVIASKRRNREELELFVQSVIDFSIIFDSLGANEISTEWLTEAERRYPFFEEINYRIFCKKN